MRLLKKIGEGCFRLTSFGDDDTPPYAILSHTWSRDAADEVSYRDLEDSTGREKAGYRKLEFCCTQARSHNLDYFWVDTCCIDKSNSTELAEAINSMFRWYQGAERCYVYLADVSLRMQDTTMLHAEWKSAFRHSRWFTRGWTLQELLASKQVEFYSQDHVRLGDKISLLNLVHEITGIRREAIQSCEVSAFSIDERLTWVQKRKTTKGEDKAYCMLGLCGVYMSLIYGEGLENAFRRLRKEIKESTEQSASTSTGVLSKVESNRQQPTRTKVKPQGKKSRAQKSAQASLNVWTAAEDAMLLSIVEAADQPRWKTVAENFSNRSDWACEKRYERVKKKIA